jgi:hypothetical protein
MSNVLALFEANLQELAWRYQRDPERELVRFGVNCANGALRVVVHVLPALDVVKCLALFPVRVPESHRLAAAEYLTRANYGLTLGNFEMDFADGEVRFRTSMSTDDGAINAVVAGHLVQQNITTADRYLAGLLRVIDASRTPAAAIAEIDGEA